MEIRLSFVVATKDRPADLIRLLESLANQTRKPDHVIVVDSSTEPVQDLLASFPQLATVYIRHLQPSAAAQRNAGIQACASNSTLIGFVDDDAEFERGAIAQMLDFWGSVPDDVAGASFNLRNYQMLPGRKAKASCLVNALGIYPRRPGGVSLSGWQSVFGEVSNVLETEWLPTTAIIWRASVLCNSRFDEFFEGYSYLEDLDFSYTVSRKYRLLVVPGAGYYHHPSLSGRCNARDAARAEVRNRFYFVRKHGLSVWRCWIAMTLRVLMTATGGLFYLRRRDVLRAAYNLQEMLRQALFHGASS